MSKEGELSMWSDAMAENARLRRSVDALQVAIESKDAEIERLQDEVKRWQGLDREALTLAGNLRVTAEATSSRVMALLDGPEARWMGEPDGWMVSTKKVRGALADAPAERLHGPGCVDCDSGVTEFHRSRTDKPNNLRAPAGRQDGPLVELSRRGWVSGDGRG